MPRPLYVWNVLNKVNRARLLEVGPDRTAAEFVARLGGRVAVSSSERRLLWLDNDSALPNPLQLKGVDLNGTSVTNAGLEHLLDLSELRILGLRDCNYIRDSAMQYILNLPLQALDVTGTKLTLRGLQTICCLRTIKVINAAHLPKIPVNVVKTTIRAALPDCVMLTDPYAPSVVQLESLDHFD